MAYSTAGEKRVNYYSSPLINYQGYTTGTPTADNARTLVENRFAVAAVGDETMICSTPTSSASATVSSAPSATVSSAPSATVTSAPSATVSSPPSAAVSSNCTDKYSNCKEQTRLFFNVFF